MKAQEWSPKTFHPWMFKGVNGSRRRGRTKAKIQAYVQAGTNASKAALHSNTDAESCSRSREAAESKLI